MIITTQTTVALVCPHCGQLSWHVLSLFPLQRGRRNLACECGTAIVTIEKKKGRYWFLTDCVFCETQHSTAFSRQELMAAAPHELYCQDADYVTGCIGPQDEVKKYLKNQHRSLTQIATEIGSADYFENPDVMFGILAGFYEMAQLGATRCPCGNEQFEVDIMPGEIRIRCQDCQMEMLVPAARPEDLENFLQEDLLFCTPTGLDVAPIWPSKLHKKSKYMR